MSASQSRTRISDRIGVHLDAETAIIVRDSSGHSGTLTDELVGKEEASPDCRVHRPIQQERQNRCVPMTVNKWCRRGHHGGRGQLDATRCRSAASVASLPVCDNASSHDPKSNIFGGLTV